MLAERRTNRDLSDSQEVGEEEAEEVAEDTRGGRENAGNWDGGGGVEAEHFMN